MFKILCFCLNLRTGIEVTLNLVTPAATNICSDKTGTLTQNVMTVVDGYFTGWACEGDLPVPAGKGCRLTPSTLQVPSRLSRAPPVDTHTCLSCGADVGDITGDHGGHSVQQQSRDRLRREEGQAE